jgi:hypothetical protein
MCSPLDPPERDLLGPVLRLYPKVRYRRFVEVPLGRKRIDVLCISKGSSTPQVCIELKVKDWRRALWQAIVNLQIAVESYVAIWYKYEDRVLRHRSLMEQYGIGLIVVDGRQARVVLPSEGRVRRISKERKKDFYEALVSV